MLCLPLRVVYLTTAYLLVCAPVLGHAEETPEVPTDSHWVTPQFWQRLDAKPVETSWEFADGEIRLTRPSGGSASLLSQPLPNDFDLSWQYKIAERTNSGIKYRVRRFGNQWLGIEYQIIDEPLTPEAAGRKGSTASIYDLVAPDPNKPNRKPGEWNEARIVARGHRLEHYLNGQLVANAMTDSVDWQYRIATSKFYGHEGFGQPVGENRILLTDHGGEVVYKDFRFVSLEDDSQVAAAAKVKNTPPLLGNAMRNSWADQTSIVLWTRTTARSEMVTDGPEFLVPDKARVAQLSKSDDVDALYASQLPIGSELETMIGACPGAPGEVQLTYFPANRSQAAQATAWQSTEAESDFTCQWKLQDLQPGTTYAAVVAARPIGSDELTAVVRGRFRTAPAATATEPLRFCMTTCHDYVRRDDDQRGHKIYPSMTRLNPHFVIHAGDVEYYDHQQPYAWTTALMRFKWARLFSLPSNRKFYANHTTYFLKDDHDTLKDDCWAGQRYGAVTFEEGVQLFNEEQFPSHQPRYKTIRWGKDLQIWLLEGRDFRSPNTMPDGPEKTILGAEQRAWLFETLAASEAPLRLIVSPTPIVGPDRAGKRDNHANETFNHEGDLLRGELAKYNGLIVLCGDRHWQYASRDRENGLWEFGCGPGSERHQLGWKPGDERPEHQFLRVAGGFLSGELSYPNNGNDAAQPTGELILRHHDVDGEIVSEFTFR